MAQDTLLVVEDNDVLREGLRDMLTFEGFTVVIARNGAEAVEKMETCQPELILSDIAMPFMDGYQFYEFVRKHQEWVTIPFIFLTALADQADILISKNLGVDDYLTKPLNREELVTTIRSRLGRSRQLQVGQLKQAYLASLTALANAVDLRDRYMSGHIEHVTAYCLLLARTLGWSERAIEPLHFAAILHDIGKLHIREATLFKSLPLNEEEWKEIRRHPVVGAEMLRDVPYLADIIPIVRHHHEHWNGRGYPDGLSGEAIPEGARILSVADTLDAMTSDRPYSRARTLESALQEIVRLSGQKYDPMVVEALQKAYRLGQIHLIAAKR
ncbi:MAG: response regulator [Anaerolineales bacterium]|nr:response regulator [Anaerolineales bacterium]